MSYSTIQLPTIRAEEQFVNRSTLYQHISSREERESNNLEDNPRSSLVFSKAAVSMYHIGLGGHDNNRMFHREGCKT